MKLAIGLLILWAVLVLLSRSVWAEDRMKRAAAAAQLGDFATAQALSAGPLAKSDPRALLIAACGALQRAKPAEVTLYLNKLERARPDAPELAVLKILAAQGDGGPVFRWLDPVVAAIATAKLGQPAPTIFNEPISTSKPLDPKQLASATGNGGFLLRLGASGDVPSDALVAEAVELSKAKLQPAVAIAVITVLTNPKLPEAKRAATLEAARELLRRTAEQYPDKLYLAMWSVLLGTNPSEPLTPSELDALDKAAAAPDTAMPLPELFDELERAYGRVAGATAYERAWNATFKLFPLDLHVVLLRRVKATAARGDAAAAARAARVLAVLGRAFVAQRSLVELNIGHGLLSAAFELSHDAAIEAESMKAKAEVAQLQRRAATLRFIASLPLAGLTREVIVANAHGELALLASLPDVN